MPQNSSATGVPVVPSTPVTPSPSLGHGEGFPCPTAAPAQTQLSPTVTGQGPWSKEGGPGGGHRCHLPALPPAHMCHLRDSDPGLHGDMGTLAPMGMGTLVLVLHGDMGTVPLPTQHRCPAGWAVALWISVQILGKSRSISAPLEAAGPRRTSRGGWQLRRLSQHRDLCTLCLPSSPRWCFLGGSHPGPADGTCPLSCGDANRGPTAKALSAHLVMERELGCLPALLRYLACTFVNHRSLCKQTHPQPSASHRPGNSAARPSILFGCAPARSAAPDKTFWLLSLPASHLGTVGLREEGAVGRGPMSPGDAPWHGCAAAPQRAPSHLRLKRNVKASRKSKH